MTPGRLSFVELVGLCAERLAEEGEAALHALCAAHPEHADALRIAIAPLLELPPAEPAVEPGYRRLGEFEIVREIGRGGMGVVYEARQPSLARAVALKVLPPAWVLDQRQVTRFQNEARAAATIEHPHLVPVYAVGSEGGTHYYAMPLIAGASVKQILHARRQRSAASGSDLDAVLAVLGCRTERDTTSNRNDWPRRAAELVRQAAQALDQAHCVGVLHRDIKPGNLLIDRRGHLWLTDFGLAHFTREDTNLTRSGEFVGTIAYSSPEQVGGHLSVDARSDVYSLGATLYEMVGGRPPFAASDHAAMMREVIAVEPRALLSVDPRLPRDLVTIVEKAMAKEPTARYQSAAAFAADLGAFLDHRPIAARPITAAQRAVRWCRRNPGVATAAAIAFLLSVVAATVGYTALRTAAERDRARLAETELSRLSSQLRIETKLEAAGRWRRSLAPGQRVASLALLREAAREADAVARPAAEREAIVSRIRGDALASLALWDATVEPLLPTTGPAALAFDSGQSRFAVPSPTGIDVVNADGGVLAHIDGKESDPLAEFDPHGEWLVVSSARVLRVWHWPTGRIAHAPGLVEERRTCWRQSHSELMAYVGKRFLAYDLVTGAWRDPIGPAAAAHVAAFGDVRQIRVSPDEQLLAVCTSDRRTLSILDLARDVPAREIPLPLHPFCVRWEPDGRHLRIGGHIGIIRLDIDTESVTESWPGHFGEVVRLASTADEQLTASRSWDGQVRLWDRRGRALIALGGFGTVPRLQFTAAGDHLGFFAAVAANGTGKGASWWRLHRPLSVREVALPAEMARVNPVVAFHPRLPLVAAGFYDEVVFIHAQSGAVLASIPLRECKSLQFLPAGDLLLCSNVEPRCTRVEVHDEDLPNVAISAPTACTTLPLESAAIVGKALIAWGEQAIRVVEEDGRERIRIDAALPYARGLSVSPCARYVALGTFGGGQTTVWNLASGKCELEVPAVAKAATTAFSLDGRWLLVAGRAEHRIFEVGSWRQVATLAQRDTRQLPGIGSFSPRGDLLAVRSSRTQVQIVDTRTWGVLFDLDTPDGGTVTQLAFSADGGKLGMGSVQGKVFLWDLLTARRELRDLGVDWNDEPLAEPSPFTELRVIVKN